MKHSPRMEQIQMDFASALEEAMKGKKVRRLEWDNENVYITVKDEVLVIFKPEDSLLHPLIIRISDIMGEDWVVIESLHVVH